jgi:hypothetical protein
MTELEHKLGLDITSLEYREAFENISLKRIIEIESLWNKREVKNAVYRYRRWKKSMLK